MSDSLLVKLGADTSDFRGEITKAAEAIKGSLGKDSGEAVGKAFSSAFERKAGLHDAFKSLFAAVGIDVAKIAENIARLFTGFDQQYENALKRVDETAKASADAQIQSMRDLMSAEQKYLLALKEREAALERIKKNAPRQSAVPEDGLLDKIRNVIGGGLLGSQFPGMKELGMIIVQRKVEAEQLRIKADLEAEAVRAAENERVIHEHDLAVLKRRNELEELSNSYGMATLTNAGRIRELKTDIADIEKRIASGEEAKNRNEDLSVKLNTLQKELLKEQNDFLIATTLSKSEAHELTVLEAKGLGKLTEEEEKRLRTLRLISKEKDFAGKMEEIYAVPIAKRTEQEKAKLSWLIRQTQEIEKQIAIINSAPPLDIAAPIREATTAAKEFQDAMADIFKQMENISEAWENFKMSITTTGKGDKDLSDRELARKVSAINADIEARTTANRLKPGSAYYDPSAPGADSLLEADKQNLKNALEEIALRTKTRNLANAFGEQQAFLLSGLSESRYSEVLGGKVDKVASGIDELNARLRAAGFGIGPSRGS